MRLVVNYNILELLKQRMELKLGIVQVYTFDVTERGDLEFYDTKLKLSAF